jgi:hypothetical protein
MELMLNKIYLKKGRHPASEGRSSLLLKLQKMRRLTHHLQLKRAKV